MDGRGVQLRDRIDLPLWNLGSPSRSWLKLLLGSCMLLLAVAQEVMIFSCSEAPLRLERLIPSVVHDGP